MSTICMLLAGGKGSRLSVLSQVRAKPAVPFGGIFRIIDFTLSNITNSGLNIVGILTQYEPLSLMEHIGVGIPWDLFGRYREAKILPPREGKDAFDWYQGTADAIYQNINFIQERGAERVVILSGDHIYNMDYQKMIDFHIRKGADATVALLEVAPEDCSRFGIAKIDDDNKIVRWQEKPQKPESNLGSMGIYVYETEYLIKRLSQNLGVDFGADIIPKTIHIDKVYAYIFDGYWQDVGTVHSYWKSNLDVLGEKPLIDFDEWKVKTNMEYPRKGDSPPAYITKNGIVKNSFLSPGCVVKGYVENSIISPDVIINENATIRDSVIMHNTIIGENSKIVKAIVDKHVLIGENCTIGGYDTTPVNRRYPSYLSCGETVIGKGARIPANTAIGVNCLVFPFVKEDSFTTKTVLSGETVD